MAITCKCSARVCTSYPCPLVWISNSMSMLDYPYRSYFQWLNVLFESVYVGGSSWICMGCICCFFLSPQKIHLAPCLIAKVCIIAWKSPRFYSGVVAGAREALICGVPSLSISLNWWIDDFFVMWGLIALFFLLLINNSLVL